MKNFYTTPYKKNLMTLIKTIGITNKTISKATCMSFPLVGNLSSEGFWTGQNDRIDISKDVVLLVNFLVKE